nr:TylF/MycF/NovP-related O-methyltransferase [Hyphomicrobium sp.]
MRLRRALQTRAEATRWQAIYDRYRQSTMLSRQAYLDNLAIASLVAGKAALSGHGVVECGTWRGGMAAGLMEILGSDRCYHFFDSFSGLPEARVIDGEAALLWQANKSGPTYFENCTASEDEFRKTIAFVGKTSHACTIHRGLFNDTVPKSETGALALLRVDGDWYDSTMTCLEGLLPRVAIGGVVIIDDYGTWDGCTRAVHDYLAVHKRAESIERYGRSAVPYLRIRGT